MRMDHDGVMISGAVNKGMELNFEKRAPGCHGRVSLAYISNVRYLEHRGWSALDACFM